MRRLRTSQTLQAAKKPDHVDLTSSLPEPTMLSESLASALLDSVIFMHDTAFKHSMNSYWAQQEREVIPACVVRPRNVQQLCTAVTVLKRDVAIGAGTKWMDVSKVLDKKGLAVIGGRNSAVGVGGLTLGGGLSFFSPRFGLVCSNILSYELVLASGFVTTASASTNPDLWRALKGGSNNFGIVTRFTARSFPSTKIWSGFLYMPASQAAKVLAAFHEFVNRADSSDPSTTYDNHAVSMSRAWSGRLSCSRSYRTGYARAMRIR
ncbi:fad binding domain protein [Lasallia pustulata]|uniref:Fad binding domain protein n=1 Tax=Lasallia pustulata TaxID=136370 RepID=A0A1W5D4I0_9LECA|nr:fad binding domain protein [Lasallia pustulata]